jgi:hypothetical protein
MHLYFFRVDVSYISVLQAIVLMKRTYSHISLINAATMNVDLSRGIHRCSISFQWIFFAFLSF